jgi:hypothetical protein
VPPQLEAVANCPADPASETFDNTRVHDVTVPTTLAQAPVDVILVATKSHAACKLRPRAWPNWLLWGKTPPLPRCRRSASSSARPPHSPPSWQAAPRSLKAQCKGIKRPVDGKSLTE